MNNNFRQDFPILNDTNNPVIYLDNAATTQKPTSVLKAMNDYYTKQNANPLRGLYNLSSVATEEYAKARHCVAEFINAKHDCEIVFTRNTTESLNLIAYTYGLENIQTGDEIVVSIMEHHSNILPWQMIAKAKNATLKYLYIDNEGNISDEEITSKITQKTKIVSITQVSNVLGSATPLTKIIQQARKVGATIVVDGAQGAPHQKVDVQALDCDFYVFSGHKMLAPMGIGVLYGKQALLEAMPPFLRGGEMIETVTEQSATFAPLPEKFEGGTPNVAGAIGLRYAIEYLNNIGFEYIQAQEQELMQIAIDELKKLPYVELYGSNDASKHHGVLSFNIKDIHPHDVASLLDYHGHIALRAGNHCAHPLLKYLNLNSTNRISFYFYNTKDDVYSFIEQIKKVRSYLGYDV